MKKTVALIEKFLLLAQGETLASSKLRGDYVDKMLDEGVLLKMAHRSQLSYKVSDGHRFLQYLAERHGLRDLEAVRRQLADGADRAGLVEATGDSKYVGNRSFKGFLVNVYEPLEATLHGSTFTLLPHDGAFAFIADYENFRIPADCTVVGIENAENFRLVARQRPFFERELGKEKRLLFVSRYPQSGDLVRWLQAIPNPYVHFGDLDLAGVHIYLTEYYRHLARRASFLIPSDYEARLAQGTPQRYDKQLPRYGRMPIADPRVQPLLDAIHRHHRGYDQEGYIE